MTASLLMVALIRDNQFPFYVFMVTVVLMEAFM